ncbi:Fur-regulated basic protein FbpA [Bacillus massiliglaciei]|uniref:Fur-regulated basic protein FbpA n=1 Tax=Bacillus massiliglaciei TaxID=1816693 RepID=UPI000DA6306A|nr:Fur-regulated basic protein FbpA [Bacillus massiliglaciei]
MNEFFKRLEQKKAVLIEKLLANGVYKTSDERHLYDAPISVLEKEYKMVRTRGEAQDVPPL